MKKIKKVKYSKLKSFKNFVFGKKQAPSGLIIVFGSRGTGKSTDIAKDELRWENKHKDFKAYTDFYTNVKINTNNEHYHYLDLVHYKLTDYMPLNEKTKNAKIIPYDKETKEYIVANTPFKINENSIIEIDELGIVAHARDYKNFPKEFIYLVKYLRKLGILMIANSQSYDIDKTLREGASDLRLKRKFMYWSLSRRIRKRIVCSSQDKSNKKATYVYNAEQQIHDELDYAPVFTKGAIKLTFIPFYTDRFNSFE